MLELRMDFDNVGTEEQASAKLSLELPADKPAGIRPMEALWILIALVLFLMHLESSDVSTYVVAEKKNECQLAKEQAAHYATALVHLLNQKTVTIGNSTQLSCRVKEIKS